MSAPADSGDSPRRFRPVRSIRKSVDRWRRRISIRLGLSPRPAERGYLICATSRSGSTYLCRLLASTGLLGNPREYFNTDGRRKRDDPTYPASRRRQLDLIRTVGATSNGIYGVKIIAAQLEEIAGRVDPLRDLPNLAVVRLRRNDVLGQAISLARARQTGQYLASDAARAPSSYNAKMIRSCLRSVHDQEAIWDALERERRLVPLVIAYEDVLRNPQQAVDRIAALMGLIVPAPVDHALFAQAIQRDSTSADWRERFLAETGDEFRHLAAL